MHLYLLMAIMDDYGCRWSQGWISDMYAYPMEILMKKIGAVEDPEWHILLYGSSSWRASQHVMSVSKSHLFLVFSNLSCF